MKIKVIPYNTLEYASLDAFPATGESGKHYLALDTMLLYTWSSIASQYSRADFRYEGRPSYHGSYLKSGYLEFTMVASPTLIDWHNGDYIRYDRTGRIYKLYGTPQVERQASTNHSGESFAYRNVQFYDKTKDLSLVPFRDLVPGAGGAQYYFSSKQDVAFTGTVANVVERLNANLANFFGPGVWNVRIADNIPESFEVTIAKDFSVSGMCQDALNAIYETWHELGWAYAIENGVDTIIIGYPNIAPATSGNRTNIFSYGNGLTALKRNNGSMDNFCTRMHVYGTERNLINRYYNGKDIYNAGSVNIPNLMIPIELWGQTSSKPDANKAFIEDADKIEQYGLITKDVYFDGTDGRPEIYPSIEQQTIEILKAAKTSLGKTGAGAPDYYPQETDDTIRVDQVKAAVQMPQDDGTPTNSGEKYIDTYDASIASTLVDAQSASSRQSHSVELFEYTFVDTGVVDIRWNGALRFVLNQALAEGDYLTLKLCVYQSEVSRNTLVASADFDVDSNVTNGQILNLDRVLSVGTKTSQVTGKFIVTLEYAFILSGGGTRTMTITKEGDILASANIREALVANFKVKTHQIGFDIAKMQSSGGATLAVRSGMCAGREFSIVKAIYNSEDDDWTLTCKRSQDTSTQTYYPNATFAIAADDEFVILGITMPEEYILAQAHRLYTLGQELFDRVSVFRPTFEPSIDSKKVLENITAHPSDEQYKLVEGKYMRLYDEDLIADDHNTDVMISEITINEGEAEIATYHVVLSDKANVTGGLSRTVANISTEVENIQKAQRAQVRSQELGSQASSPAMINGGTNVTPVYIKDGMPQPIDGLDVENDVLARHNVQALWGVSAYGMATLGFTPVVGGGTLTKIKINGTPLTDVSGVVDIPLATTQADGAMSAADKTKLNTIAPYADANLIEKIYVNSVEQTITNKAVYLSVPTALSQLTDDATHRLVTDTLIGRWNGVYNVVPAAAYNTGNELADKAFVNSSVATATATFRGTNTTATTESAFLVWANGLTHDLNDYVFWQTTDSVGNVVYKRYKYDGTQWVFEYDLNNSSFTADQWAAINSGITGSLVTSYSNHIANTSNPHGVTKAQVGLGSVENTALSTWAGTSNITTLGTITTGVWNGTAIGYDYLASAVQTSLGNANTAYGWGDHAQAGYALAANLGTAATHAHTDYVTGITWDSTNRKLKQSKGGGTATDIVTFGEAYSYGVYDKNAATAAGSSGTGLVTERALYYALPTVNGGHSYKSSDNIYAPTSAGTAGQYLKSTGGAPTWEDFAIPYLEWSGGTSEGPKLQIFTDGGGSQDLPIPTATAAQSGVVIVGPQTFGGAKTFDSTITAASHIQSTNGNIEALHGGVAAYGIASLTMGAAGGAGTLTKIKINGTPLTDVSGVVNIPLATTQADGAMSSADKSKLDGIETNANNYVLPAATANALGGIKVGTNLSIDSNGVLSATDTTYTFYNLAFQNGNSVVDTYKPTTSPSKTIKAGSNVTISAASNVITIAATDTTYAFASGDNNGQIKVTPSGGTAQNIDVTGLDTAAFHAASDFATSGHTHATSIASSTGTNQLNLNFGTKYALTAGGTNFIFTMPTASISNGVITIGSNNITPLTSHQTLYNLVINNSAGTAQITYKPAVSGTYALTLTKAMVGLGNVENTALSTWTGSTNITTLGTITTGKWQGTAIADSYIASAAAWNAKQDAISDLATIRSRADEGHTAYGYFSGAGRTLPNNKLVNSSISIAGTSVSLGGSITAATLKSNLGLGNSAYVGYDTAVTKDSTNLITSGAVWTAIDNLPEPMVFKGSLGTGGTITALPVNGSASIGDTYKVITAGTYASKAAKVGDTFICLTKTSSANTWELIPSGDEPSGTVTSVGLSMPTGFSVSSSPVTSSGTLTVAFASGYSLPTTAKQSNWDTAYGWGNHASAGYALASNLGTASTHAHGDYVTAIGTSGNTLTWSKGGTAQTAITVPYATNADTVDGLHASSFYQSGKGFLQGSQTYNTNWNALFTYESAGGAARSFLLNIEAHHNNTVINKTLHITTTLGGGAHIREFYSSNYGSIFKIRVGSADNYWRNTRVDILRVNGTDGTIRFKVISLDQGTITAVNDTNVSALSNSYEYEICNIESATVSYASSAGSVAWDNVTSHPTKLSDFTDDLGSNPTHTHSQYVPIKPHARFYNYIGSSQGGQWYKVTLPFHATTSTSSRWMMVSMEIVLKGNYNTGADGRIYLSYYIYYAANNNVGSAENVYGIAIGSNMNGVRVAYLKSDLGIFYIYQPVNYYNAIAIQNLSACDSAPIYDFTTTTIEAFSASSASVPAEADIQDIAIRKIYTQTGSGVYIDGATVWNADNDGSGSGLDADTLDACHLMTKTTNWNTISSNPSIFISSENNTTNAPSSDYTYGIKMRFHRDEATYQTELVTSLYHDRLFYRRHSDSSQTTTSWKELAFVDSNVASATKLATARTIWGQSFDGSANISGDMTNVGNISFSATGKNIGGIAYFDTTNARLGIGTSSPVGKLDVNGTIIGKGVYSNGYYYLPKSGESGWLQCIDNGGNHPIFGYGFAASGYDCTFTGNNVHIVAGTSWSSRTNGIEILANGNVGIGKQSPAYKLDVNGDVQATNFRGALVGNADTATALTTVSKTAWGQTFWTSGGIPATISGDMSNVGDITPSANLSKNIGSSSLQFESVYASRYLTGSGNGMRFVASTGRYRWYDSDTISESTLLMELRRTTGLVVDTDVHSTRGMAARGIADLSVGGGGTGGTVTSITAGTGLSGGTITMNGTIALKVAGTTEIGGIQIGFSESNSGSASNRNYAVQLSNNKAFVNVPWTETTDSTVAGWGYKKGMVYTTATASDSSIQVATGANPTYQFVTNTAQTGIAICVTTANAAANTYGVHRYIMIYNNRSSAITINFADNGEGVIGPADSVSIPAYAYMEFSIIHPASNAKCMVTWSMPLKAINTL